jgi:hypothetical protein
MTDYEIAPGDRSGGATTSHTALIPSLIEVLNYTDRNATLDDYERAVVENNLLGTSTTESRTRMFRAMRELYLLRPEALLFRALRDLWSDDPRGQPLLAGLCALARDPVFRAGSSVITGTDAGDTVTSAAFGEAVAAVFPDAYNERTIAKIGRNHYASWEQVGHLEPANGNEKTRRRPICTASTTAYALLLGHLEGTRGPALFETIWAKVLDHPRSYLIEMATLASHRSLVDFRHSGGVTEVSFSELLRPMEGNLL